MYAVIKTGGKQYRVEPGDVVRFESLDGEVGSSVTLDDVLLVGEGDDIRVGAPRVENAAGRLELAVKREEGKLTVTRTTRLTKSEYAPAEWPAPRAHCATTSPPIPSSTA